MNTEKAVTGRRVWLFLIAASVLTLSGAYAIWQLVVQGEETMDTWIALAFTPMAVLFWATYIRRAVPQKLEHVLGFIMTVFLAVGWYRTESWFLGLATVVFVLWGGYLVLRQLRAERA